MAKGLKGPDWGTLIRRMEQLMRLTSFPVAFKMLEKKGDLEKIPFMRRMKHKVTLCQMITLVRNADWTVGAERDDFPSPMCPSVIGLADTPDYYKDGTFRSIVWTRTKEEGRKYEESIPRLPLGRYEAVALAPLVYNPFDPDIVLIYANPAQIMLLINSLQFENYEVMTFHCVGESSCSDAIARCYLTGRPSLAIPCYGERRYGHARDEDLVMALPAGMMEKALRGMEALYRRGVRYPISYAGPEMDLTDAFPPAYGALEKLEEVRGKDDRLLLAVTGGIATGKSTVTRMLEEKGAPLINFDDLAREVVRPGRPAWRDIVDYFGKQVLGEDGTIDRKKLSDIVFRDMEKRKKLESFTHPRIDEAFREKVNRLARENPGAVIQVEIPLLIELNLQYLYHKVLLVYTPREKQIERLVERDGITVEQAENILKAQLPIEEKVGYADYVIHNEHSLEETRRQVDALWEELTGIQKQKARKIKGK
ncbi:MAG: dephospho-CoA kinase [Deltaproteobacteria bacterium]|nr:dephospho-CoA kinase [Deltaproteobacteria bacterium]MBW2302413.1 dephospho-CoA kinase [Deltaproteobacteria bacterium]